MIRKINIEHYKSVAYARLTLGQTSVLVGSNSAGKSNFIDAISFLRDAAVHGLEQSVSDRHGIDSIIQWSPTRPYNLEISANYETDNGTGHYAVKLSSKARQPTVLEETGQWRSPDQTSPIFFSRHKNSISLINVSAQAQKNFARFVGSPQTMSFSSSKRGFRIPDCKGFASCIAP
jgi:predicted ATPase